MDDQNQTKPQLTLEEELDVLEAVYKIGKEKGLELLRPDQLKKLRDGGRMGKHPIMSSNVLVEDMKNANDKLLDENAVKMADLFILTLRKSVEKILIEDEKYCSLEEWKNKDLDLRRRVINLFFYLFYGIRETELRQNMVTKFSLGVDHG